jgi:hypothetical protein
MKTTVEIADSLFDQAQALALKEGTNFHALVEEGLRTLIESRTGTPSKPFRLRDGSFKDGKGLQSGIEWTQLFSLVYDDESGRQKR